MPETPRRVYCDANLFLAYISNEPDHAQDVERLLDEAESDKVEVLTSIITMTEVAFAQIEKDQGQLDKAIEERIDALWDPPSPIVLVEYHAGLARDARRLMRRSIEAGWSLRPFDAIHLATAAALKVDQIYSYEPKWKKYAEMVGVQIGPLVFEQTVLPLHRSETKPV